MAPRWSLPALVTLVLVAAELAPTSLAVGAAAPPPEAGSATEPSSRRPVVRTYTVAAGESLADVAARYGVGVATLRAANSLQDIDRLQVGQQLRVPSADGVLHVVQPGDTLQTIADRYGVDLGAVIAANGLDGAPDVLAVGSEVLVPGGQRASQPQQAEPAAPQAEQRAAAAVRRSHVVQSGDTLHSIAESLGVDILSLIAVNGLDDPDILTPGRELRMPAPPREHVVQTGETLGDIAWRYDIDVRSLLRANAIDDPDLVGVGRLLIVPAAGAIPSAPAPATTPTAVPTIAATPTPQPTPTPPAAPASPRQDPITPPAPAGAPAAGQVVTALITGYALGAGASSSHTASGTTTHWGTVAADTRLYPFGTRVRIEGFDDMVFVVEDTGSAVRGNIFDVWFPDVAAARAFGGRTRRVTILPPGG